MVDCTLMLAREGIGLMSRLRELRFIPFSKFKKSLNRAQIHGKPVLGYTKNLIFSTSRSGSRTATWLAIAPHGFTMLVVGSLRVQRNPL